MSGKDCVPLADCGCKVEEAGIVTNYPGGAIWFSDDCLKKFECVEGEIKDTPRKGCDNDAHCEFNGVDDTATCVCNAGFYGDGYNCKPECPELDHPDNGKVEVEGQEVGHTATYTCDFGFVIKDGDIMRTCQDDGTWSGDAPVCTQECPSDEWVQTATHCYLAVKQRKNWESAVKHCENTEDSHLTPMTSDEERDTLIDVMSAIRGRKYKHFWLGASLDLGGSGEITWADPDVVSDYRNWDRKMPAKIKGSKKKRNNCVIVGQKSGKWSNKGACKGKKGFVCRKEL